jgi:hypothetical protein
LSKVCLVRSLSLVSRFIRPSVTEVTMEHQHVSDDVFAHANREQCRDALSLVDDLLRNILDSGWWIMSRINKLQPCAKFDHSSEKAKNVLNTIMTIIDKYYVNAESHLKKLCRVENIPENECSTTSNEIIVNFRNKYANAISQGELICLDIPLNDLSTILVNLNSLFVGLTMQFKKGSVANNIQHAVHVPMFIPFNHNTDLLFHKFTIEPNPQFLKLTVTEPNNNLSKTP